MYVWFCLLSGPLWGKLFWDIIEKSYVWGVSELGDCGVALCMKYANYHIRWKVPKDGGYTYKLLKKMAKPCFVEMTTYLVNVYKVLFP